MALTTWIYVIQDIHNALQLEKKGQPTGEKNKSLFENIKMKFIYPGYMQGI